jgi:probable phosphoglycerate mutase
MVQVVLIRPGCTDYDQQRRIQGNLDVPLNEQGAAEIDQVVEQLRQRGVALDALYCSCGEPAGETGQRIAEALGVKLRKLDNLQNVNLGLWQGMLTDEVRIRQPKVYRQWQEQPECVCPPEGEMIGRAAQRVQAAMSRLLKRHKDGTIGLVVPEPLASLVRRWLGSGVLGDLWKAAAERAPWEVLEVGPALERA